MNPNAAFGQSNPPQASQPAATLPPVQIDAPKRKRAVRAAPRNANSVARRRVRARSARRPPAPPVPNAATPAAFGPTQDVRTGTSGVYANSTSVATKTNTPLINIPQSLTVVTQQTLKDQNPPSLTEVTRYIPGVAVHQGEGNRDELVIRGVDSSANFFVNGFRDDVQIFRDIYNTQSIEVLRGPSALTFGRGSGGGLVNRTLKEADGNSIYETTLQTGSYGDRRVSVDAGQAINQNVAARLNAFYESSDTFRDFGKLERYGINPTATFKVDDDTKVKLSYEYYHDDRTADRGNPSQALPAVPGAPAGATRFNPTTPFAPNGDLTAFFGSPTLNLARANVQTVMGVIEHDFGNGLTVKNSTLFASYQKFYQNVYPGNGALAGAVDPTDTFFNRAAYQHTTNRDNLFNQTDFVYKTALGSTFHTFAFGTEFGRQAGIDVRNTGGFPIAPAAAGNFVCPAGNGGVVVGGLSNTVCSSPLNPTYFGPVVFLHNAFQTDSNSKYTALIDSGYLRDTIDVNPWLQLIAGVRFDHFDLTALDMNAGIQRGRIDDKASPQAAVIVKPRENLSIYAAYSVSYLPASGDQFSSLNPGTAILEPQGFENKEVGVKWNILPKLLFTAAAYQLDRTNVPIADPNNPGFFLPSGSHKIRGIETALTGYIMPDWQATLGYAFTDARITSNTSATVVAGNRVQLVPYNQVSLWNKYQIDPRWGVGLGVIYFSDSYASSDDTVKLPGFVRVDAAVYAKIDETWRVQLNIENIFNKGYWASADGNNNISPGEGRTFRLAATARF
jgi:catecholate siderophore receptor